MTPPETDLPIDERFEMLLLLRAKN